MCGIVGLFSSKFEVDSDQIDSAISSIKHRGPDGVGIEITQYGFLGHTRLSIIDTAPSGRQPFVKLGGKIVTAHNGEIYNHLDLKKLTTQNYDYIGHSDSEVIPYLYNDFGISRMCTMIEGMFSICIADIENKLIHLVRDPFGIKPLYYSHRDNHLYFGSEIKAIKALAPVELTIDTQSILDFLCLGYIIEPQTIYHEIKAVPPGSILTYDLDTNNISIHHYHTLSSSLQPKTNIDELSSLLKDIIQEQSAADVPIGVFLSGGVDSTLVSAYFASVNTNVNSFTIKFNSPERDESQIAAQTARYLGTNHKEVHVKEILTWDQMIKLLLHFDQPFGDLSFLPTYIISQEVQKSIKVVLSGDGGDEFAGGYLKFLYFKMLQIYCKTTPLLIRRMIHNTLNALHISNRIKKFTNLAIQSPESQLFGLSTYIAEDEARSFLCEHTSLNTPVRHFSFDRKLDYAQNVTINQCKTSLSSKMLTKVDRMSMLAGIEVRVPLLDTRLTNRLYSLPSKFKVRGTTNKLILRQLLRAILPGYDNSKKIGFDFDYKDLVSVGWASRMVNDLRISLNSKDIVWKYLNPNTINQWLDNYESDKLKTSSKSSQFQLLFNLFTLHLWFKHAKSIKDL